MANKARLHTLCTTALVLVSSNFGFASPYILPRAVSKYVAFGESYASGIAAGQPYIGGGTGNENKTCNRFDGAYAVQVKDNPRVRAANFDFLACSGSWASDVQTRQVPYLDQAADFVTVSMGGNDVGFGGIVNACVYRFNGPLAPDCNAALNNASITINNDTALLQPLTNTIKAILDRAPNAKVYVTGYTRFWNAVTTQCDNVSWNYWQLPGATKMTRALRQTMNDLLIAVNGKINTAVQNLSASYPNRIVFVDYDLLFEGHRFCEEGVNEPQVPDEPRPNTYFFQVNTPIGSIQSTMAEQATQAIQVTQEPSSNPNKADMDGLAGVAGEAAALITDDGFVPPFYPANQFYDWIKAAQAASPTTPVNPAYAAKNVTTDLSGGLPLWITKIFHPTSPGHIQIADAIAARV